MTDNNSEFRIRKYYPPPPLIGTFFEYIDVNKDTSLRKSVTMFVHKKVIKWVNNESASENCIKAFEQV